MPKITVKQSENELEIPVEILAESIVKIATGIDILKKSRFTERAILLLLHDVTKLPRTDIKKVLDATQVLQNMYLKPVKK